MSQIYKSLASGPVPPSVATSYTTDNGTAVPALSILDVRGIDVTDNNNNGIQVEGGLAQTGASNRVQVQITNRLQGITSTSGAASANIVVFTPAVTGTYSMEFRIAVYIETSLLGAGYSLFGAIRFDGVNSNICDIFDEIVNEEGAMTNLDIAVTIAGANVQVVGTGYGAEEINWSAVGMYTFIGVV